MDDRRKESNHVGSGSGANEEAKKEKGKEAADGPKGDPLRERLQASGRLVSDALTSVNGGSDVSGLTAGSSKDHEMRHSWDTLKLPDQQENNRSRYQERSSPMASGPSFRGNQTQGSQEQAFNSFMAQEGPSLNTLEVYAPIYEGDVVRVEDRDGAEVASLLSQVDHITGVPTGAEQLSDALSPVAISKLREALFGSDHGQAWSMLLDFNPDWLRRNESSEEMRSYLGVSNHTEGRDMWLNGWDEVLSGYNEEVWGDLSSIVVDARSQLKEAEKDKIVPEGGALERLRMIVSHIRGYV